ncbi:hypothetical protein, partial [Pseudomonas syringae]|uniref:hypothetical protein n=2 Tax=Pseudomonas syringae group TaxID=136849 RepID=UPI001F43FAA5
GPNIRMNTASIIYLLTAVLGFALAVAGVYVLLGVGWALLAAASSCFVAAAFIRRGLTIG